MGILEQAEILRNAVTSVFSTMLGTDLVSLDPFQDLTPPQESEISAIIGLAGDVAGCVSLHSTREQATEFTARLIGMDVEDVSSDDEVRDAFGEILNMIAGNVKTALVSLGEVEIALPTVITTPKAQIRVQGATGTVVPFEDYTGVFYVELVVDKGA
jgi:chemotaxis protein CheX